MFKKRMVVRAGATAMVLFLAMVAAFYMRSGVRTLMAWDLRLENRGDSQSFQVFDLFMRWIDQQYVLRGRNPYDVVFASSDPAGPESYARSVGRDCTPDPELGPPEVAGGYPPWSFVAGAAFFGPPWWVMRPYTVLLDLLSLAVIGGWAYRLGGGLVGAVFAAACLACNGYAGAISIGQQTIIVVASLVLAYWLAERSRPWACGLLLGIAMFKPTIAGPFLLCFFVRGQWKPIISCLVYLASASAVVWLATATDPLEMTSQMLRAAEGFLRDGTGPINGLIDAGVDRKAALRGMATGSVGLATVLMWVLRRDSLLTLFAVAAVCSRIWTYHRPYDDVVMVFLLLALGVRARRTEAHLDWALFFLTSLMLLASPRYFPAAPFTAAQLVVWTAGLARLVRDHLATAASHEVRRGVFNGFPGRNYLS